MENRSSHGAAAALSAIGPIASLAPRPKAHGAVPRRASAGDDFRAAVARAADRLFASGLTFTTADLAIFVARQPGCESNRKHSAAVLQELCALEALGRIHRRDNRMPIVWVKA